MTAPTMPFQPYIVSASKNLPRFVNLLSVFAEHQQCRCQDEGQKCRDNQPPYNFQSKDVNHMPGQR